VKPESIAVHLKTLTKKDWQKLFSLIPIIESTEKFSTGGDIFEDKNNPESWVVTPEIESQIVFDFLDVMEELDLIIPFHWSAWEDGKSIFKKREYKNLDTITLLKLLTAFIRQDHFSYGGALASRFEDGTIGKILNELRKNIEKQNETL